MSDPIDTPNGESAGAPLSEPNLPPPIRLQGVNANGVVLEAAQKGESVSVSFRGALTSDDPAFHQLAENFEGVIVHGLQKAGRPLIWINDAHNVLLVVHGDDSADLWVNNVATMGQMVPRREIAAGEPLNHADIAEVTEIWFPGLTLQATYRLIYIFRNKWRYGLFYEFNPNGCFDELLAKRDIARIWRRLTFHHLYDTLSN